MYPYDIATRGITTSRSVNTPRICTCVLLIDLLSSQFVDDTITRGPPYGPPGDRREFERLSATDNC